MINLSNKPTCIPNLPNERVRFGPLKQSCLEKKEIGLDRITCIHYMSKVTPKTGVTLDKVQQTIYQNIPFGRS